MVSMEENPMPNQEPNVPPPISPPVEEIQIQTPTLNTGGQGFPPQDQVVSLPKPDGGRRQKMFKVALLAVVLLVIAGLIVSGLVSKNIPNLKQTTQKLLNIENFGGKAETPITPETSSQTPKIVEGTESWLEYKKEGVGFSFKYPADMAINEVSPGFVKIRKDGPNQGGHEEFVDGIFLWFRSLDAGDLTLKQAADETYISLKEETNVSFPVVGSLGGVAGYTFRIKGSVGLDYYYLPLGENLFLEVVNGTKDPTSQGFNSIADKILATLVISR